MIKVSEDFKNRMQDYTDFKERAEITLLDGTILEFNEDDFTLSNNSISDGAGVSSIPLGVAVGRSVQLELMNDDDHLRKYNFIGAKIRLYLTFYLENEEKNVIADKEGDALATTEGLNKIIASSPYSKIEYGLFTVISPETYGTTVIITGYDDMYKANQAYDSKLIFPATAGEVLRDCCSDCGISLKTSEFKNSSVQISIKPSNEYTYRQVIGYIAMIAAGNARINRSGYLEVLTYTFDYSNGYNSLTEWINLKTDTDDIVITGISTEIEDEDNNKTTLIEGDKGYVLSIENPLMSGSEKTLLSLVGDVLIGIAFRKFEGDYIAYPLAEFMDLAKITDLNGNVYNTFITDINFVFFGQTTIKNSAESGIRTASSYQSLYQKAIIETRKIVENEKTERKTAIENLKKALENAGGMYSTYEELPDGGVITYIHDKKELKDSQNVIKITSEAVGVSNDGGKTYPYGFILTGELIAKLLYVEGINADYINTGAITIKDREGNIIFSVNMDTKKIYISGDSVQIGGKALSDKLEEIENSVASSKNMSMQLSNEYQAIPVDSEGKYEEFPDASTQVAVFYGNTNITNDCSYSFAKSDYVGGNWNSSSHVYTITGLSANSGWVDIKATYLNSLSLTRRFSVAKLYAGQKGLQGEKGEQGIPGKDGVAGRTYFIEPSVNTLKHTKDNTVMPNNITFNAYYRDGDSVSRTAYSGRFVIEETTDGNNWTTLYASTANENSVTRTVEQLGISELATSVRCKLYAAGGTTQLIDMQSISILIDIDNLTQEQVFNILTNNGAAKGIYKEGENLYINATYLVTGIISDKAKKNYWDLDNGKFVTTLAEIGEWKIDSECMYKNVQIDDKQYVVRIAPVKVSNPDSTYIVSCQERVMENNSWGEWVIKFALLGSGNVQFGDNYIKSNGEFRLGPMHSQEIDGRIYTNFSSGTNDQYLELSKIIYYDDNGSYSTHAYLFHLHDSETDKRTCLDLKGPSSQGWADSLVMRCDNVSSNSFKITHYYREIFNDLASFEKSAEVNGNLYVYGTKNRVVKTENYSNRNLYCYEMPSPFFGDIGEGVLDNLGKCIIMLDEIFSETITTDIEYQVFLQKEGPGDAWVQEKNSNYFEINGSPGLKFAWELKARQKDFASERMEFFDGDSEFNDIDYESEAIAMVNNFYKSLEVTK